LELQKKFESHPSNFSTHQLFFMKLKKFTNVSSMGDRKIRVWFGVVILIHLFKLAGLPSSAPRMRASHQDRVATMVRGA
jgi:hypothetical protein